MQWGYTASRPAAALGVSGPCAMKVRQGEAEPVQGEGGRGWGCP
jgi:hypothetical protein